MMISVFTANYTGTLQAVAVVAIAVGLLQPTSAYADPPSWAPAWGYREHHHHKHYYYRHENDDRYDDDDRDDDRAVYVRPRAYATAQPATPCGSGLVGGAIGGAAGGYLGSQFGHGDGKLAMTAAGAVLGAVAGSTVAKSGCR